MHPSTLTTQHSIPPLSILRWVRWCFLPGRLSVKERIEYTEQISRAVGGLGPGANILRRVIKRLENGLPKNP